MTGLRVIPIVLAIGSGAIAGPDAPAEPRLRLEERLHVDSGTPVRVGTFAVPENRDDPDGGRWIELSLVVLPALSDDPAADPVFFIAGGPGQSAASMFDRYADSWIRSRRDIVLVSQRGTAGSNPLDCAPGGDPDDLQTYLEPLFRVEPFRECLETLRSRADLRMYSTCHAMDDLDEVREALGYDTINLIGGSYGTRASLIYMRRHGEHVRTATLNGVAPIAFTNPLYHAREAQLALDRIVDECARDADCARVYGDLQAKFAATLARLAETPAEVEVTDPRTQDRAVVTLSRDAFAGSIRIMMYSDSRDVPLLIDRAFRGAYEQFAQAALETSIGLRDSISLGMLLCVTCAEDVARIDEEAIGRETAGTFLGDARVRQQMAVCAIWPKSILPEDYAEPVRSDAPTLILSGTLDPVTSSRWGEEAARHLPNARHVIVPGSHFVGGPCVARLQREFLERGSAADLDTSCVERIRLGPFTMPSEITDESEPRP